MFSIAVVIVLLLERCSWAGAVTEAPDVLSEFSSRKVQLVSQQCNVWYAADWRGITSTACKCGRRSGESMEISMLKAQV